MKGRNSSRRTRAFTLIELLAVIAILAILAALIVPVLNGRPPKSPRTHCMSNLRQIGLGTIMWCADHQDRFSWQVSVADGGTMETSGRGQVSPHFQMLTNITDPKIFLCPSEKVRHAAAARSSVAESNASYFIHLDVPTNSWTAALSGDRHLQLNGKPVKPGLLLLTTNAALGWTGELHPTKSGGAGGILLFMDGHVEWNKQDPSAGLQRPDLAANRLAVP